MTAVLDSPPGTLDRFSAPLYTVAEAARYLDVPASTLATWAKGYRRRSAGRAHITGAPVLTRCPPTAGGR
jgi:transposase-like protein